MGEQNRRAVEVEPAPGDTAPRNRPVDGAAAPPDSGGRRALDVAADERQTVRQAPPSAGPGESGERDSTG
jgi:hypothetical protein